MYAVLCLATIGSSIAYTIYGSQSNKTAFFYNQQVFSKFEGKIHLEEKLAKQKEMNKHFLDSLSTLIRNGRNDLTSIYEERAQGFSLVETQLSDRYTEEIWKFINESVQEYGKRHDYSFIFGATGDGSLMYADERKDITVEIIQFTNSRYTGREATIDN